MADSSSSSNAARLPRFSVPVVAAAIFGATLLAYFPSLNGAPLWDDAAHLTAPALQNWSGLWQIWFKLGATQQYYPVLHSAFWLEHKIWGDAVLGYHLLNTALHATAACLFAVLLGALRTDNRADQSGAGSEWLAAAVFALHPVCVESVAWISEQKNTLSLVFYLLAALAYLRFDRERGVRWYALASGFFLLALLSKSVTATLPAALLLGFYWRRGRLHWRTDIVPLLPWFVVGLAAGLFTAWVERTYIAGKAPPYGLDLLQRTLLAGRVVWFYLGKLVWPSNLIFIYPRWEVAVTGPWISGCLALAVTLGALWRWRRRNRGALVAALFFGGSLFPALGFFYVYPFIFSYVADHWQYLPCLGIVALFGVGVPHLAGNLEQRSPAHRRKFVRIGFAVGIGGVLATLFFLTWRQNGIYRDVRTLYTDTLAKNPACWMAHNNLGLYLIENGSPAEGISHLEQAIHSNPDHADAHNNLGNALAKIPGRTVDAIRELETALRLQPDMVEAHGNLGRMLIEFPDRLPEGINHLRWVLERRPDLAETHYNLGSAFAKLPGRLPDAIAAQETALRLKPDFAAAMKELGTALAMSGRPIEAAAALERCIALSPDNADAHNNLGGVLQQLGRNPEAIAQFQTALRLNPGSVEAHFNLGRALRQAGDWPAALAQYQEAVRLAPERAEIRNSLGSAFYQLERTGEAVAAYAEAVRLEPDSATYHNNLGLALREIGRPDDALAHFRAALKINPAFADAHFNLGLTLQQLGRLNEAELEFSASGRNPP